MEGLGGWFRPINCPVAQPQATEDSSARLRRLRPEILQTLPRTE